jgi:peptidoglycan/xylan/chitin deacetylase (PgdA/CDA1 family)
LTGVLIQPKGRLLRYRRMHTFFTRFSAPAAIGAILVAGLFAPHANALPARAERAETQEIHQRLSLAAGEKTVALTLDACGGAFDHELVNTLIELRVPATVFVTRKWIDRNPAGINLLRAHPALFEIEDHGAEHVPAVVGPGKRVYGIPGQPDVAHLQGEVEGGAMAIERVGAPRPQWYRGATAVYDQTAIRTIAGAGYRIAGFSVNADAGATLPRREIIARLRRLRSGDIIIAHMNKPQSQSAEALRDVLPELLQQGFRFVTLRDRAVEPVR